MAHYLPRRDPNSHKGQNGKILVVGGSYKYTGAPALAAMAALRCGVDLAVVLAPDYVSNTIRAYSPNLIVNEYPGMVLNKKAFNEFKKIYHRFDSFIFGPGLSEEIDKVALHAMLELVLEKKVILDADALKFLPKTLGKNWVLTPNANEAKYVPKDHKCVVVYKGRIDRIVAPGKEKSNTTGNAGMTVGGTGDVLSGATAAMLCYHEPFTAAYYGARLTGEAGDLAFKEFGYSLLATDMIEKIPHVIRGGVLS